MYTSKDQRVRDEVRQPVLIRSVRFMQVEPPPWCARVIK